MMKVLDPVGQPTMANKPLATRPTTLNGKKLGVLSNGKPNSANLLRVAVDRMQHKYQLTGVVFIDKYDHRMTANDTITDDMVRQLSECGAVLHASGD